MSEAREHHGKGSTNNAQVKKAPDTARCRLRGHGLSEEGSAGPDPAQSQGEEQSQGEGESEKEGKGGGGCEGGAGARPTSLPLLQVPRWMPEGVNLHIRPREVDTIGQQMLQLRFDGTHA